MFGGIFQSLSLIDIKDFRVRLILIFSIGFALVFVLLLEHIFGYLPCDLCYKQRYAYYASLFILIFLWSLHRFFCLFLLSLLFFFNTILAFYHSGIEFGWWVSIGQCNAPDSSERSSNLFNLLENNSVISCDTPNFYILGLSLANLNLILSVFLFIFCSLILLRSFRRFNKFIR